MKLLTLLISVLLTFSVYTKTIVLTPTNHVVMEENFTSLSTAQLMQKVMDLKNGENAPRFIYLILDSPGGSVKAGLQMIDFLRAQNIKIYPITFFAASMGFIVSQAFGKRYMVDHGILMSHLAATSNMSGSFPNGSLNAKMKLWNDIMLKVDKMVVKKTKGKHTIKSYRDLISRDWWATSDMALSEKMVDEVVKVKCSKELSGSSDVVKSMQFMGRKDIVKYKKSNCPAIRSPLSTQVQVKNVFINIDKTHINKEIKERIINSFNNRAINW